MCLSEHTLSQSVLASLRLCTWLFFFFQPSTCFIIQFIFHTLSLLDFLLCYSATLLQLTPSLLLLCVMHKHLIFLSNTHTHNPSRIPNIPHRLDYMQCRMSNIKTVLSLVIASRCQKHTFRLADNNRITLFESVNIIKTICQISFTNPDK